MTTVNNQQGIAAIAVESGVSASAIYFFSSTIVKMIPYLYAAIPLIILDCIWGVKAARLRYDKTKNREDKPRFSKGLRRTIGKTCEYICWAVVAATLSLAFERKWIEWIVIGVVYGNEILSIFGNYLECKGIDFGIIDLYKLIFRKGAAHVGVEISEEEADQVFKPRDSRGRFIKRSEAK
jgi:hypothetical protein